MLEAECTGRVDANEVQASLEGSHVRSPFRNER